MNGGAIIEINTYDSFGVPNFGAPLDSNEVRFAYTGQLYIPELEMYHYKARVYDPKLGRFLQTDPVGYEDQMNLYAYVGNDPMTMVDPTGEVGIFGALLGAGIEIARQAYTGELSMTGKSLGKIGVAAAAGAVGANLARGVSAAANSARGVYAGNAAAGANVGMAATVANNAIDGNNLGDGVLKGAGLGAAGATAGQALGDVADALSGALKGKPSFEVQQLTSHVNESTGKILGANAKANSISAGEGISNAIGNSTGLADSAAGCNRDANGQC